MGQPRGGWVEDTGCSGGAEPAPGLPALPDSQRCAARENGAGGERPSRAAAVAGLGRGGEG